MKRGNTALKRGVGLASAFALAIAGAVVAAPAANATLPATTQIRATPAVDAAYASGTYVAGADYGTTAASVPAVGIGSGQLASNIQVSVPTGFAANDIVEVTLSAGATFTGTPVATISGLVDIAELDEYAGHDGTNAHMPPAATGVTGDAPSLTAPQLDSTKTKVSFKLTKASQTGTVTATGTAGYVINLTNVQLTVKDNGSGSATLPTGITATVNGATAATAVIAYTSPFSVSAADGYPANAKGAIELPAITVAEQAFGAFANSNAVTFSVDGEKAVASTPVTLDSANVKVTPNVATLTVDGTTAGKAYSGALSGMTLTTTDNTKLEAVTITGLKVSGLKAGSPVTLTLTAPVATTATNAGALALAAPAATGTSVTLGATSQPARIAGDNRYATAGDIASNFKGTDTVIIANGLDSKQGADALSASFLAGAKNAPVLLADSSSSLPQATQDALVALAKATTSTTTFTIYVSGATDSVSAAAEAQAKFLATAALPAAVTKGVVVVRLDGDNRYDTSAMAATAAGAIAVRSFNLGEGLYKTAFLASGLVNADALAAGAASAGAGIPVLLSDGSSVNADVVQAIKDLNIKQLVVLGGTDRISDGALDALKSAGTIATWTRVAGADRYETSVKLNTLVFAKISDKGLGQTLSDATAYLANGAGGWADALSVGSLAGKGGVANPVLTVQTDKLGPAEQFLKDNKAGIHEVVAVGGTDRVSNDVVVAGQKAIL